MEEQLLTKKDKKELFDEVYNLLKEKELDDREIKKVLSFGYHKVLNNKVESDNVDDVKSDDVKSDDVEENTQSENSEETLNKEE